MNEENQETWNESTQVKYLVTLHHSFCDWPQLTFLWPRWLTGWMIDYPAITRSLLSDRKQESHHRWREKKWPCESFYQPPAAGLLMDIMFLHKDRKKFMFWFNAEFKRRKQWFRICRSRFTESAQVLFTQPSSLNCVFCWGSLVISMCTFTRRPRYWRDRVAQRTQRRTLLYEFAE